MERKIEKKKLIFGEILEQEKEVDGLVFNSENALPHMPAPQRNPGFMVGTFSRQLGGDDYEDVTGKDRLVVCVELTSTECLDFLSRAVCAGMSPETMARNLLTGGCTMIEGIIHQKINGEWRRL